MSCILLDFPCVSQVLTRNHRGSILQVHFSTRLDVDPKKKICNRLHIEQYISLQPDLCFTGLLFDLSRCRS